MTKRNTTKYKIFVVLIFISFFIFLPLVLFFIGFFIESSYNVHKTKKIVYKKYGITERFEPEVVIGDSPDYSEEDIRAAVEKSIGSWRTADDKALYLIEVGYDPQIQEPFADNGKQYIVIYTSFYHGSCGHDGCGLNRWQYYDKIWRCTFERSDENDEWKQVGFGMA